MHVRGSLLIHARGATRQDDAANVLPGKRLCVDVAREQLAVAVEFCEKEERGKTVSCVKERVFVRDMRVEEGRQRGERRGKDF